MPYVLQLTAGVQHWIRLKNLKIKVIHYYALSTFLLRLPGTSQWYCSLTGSTTWHGGFGNPRARLWLYLMCGFCDLELNAKNAGLSHSRDLTRLHKSPKWKDRQHFCSSFQVTVNTGLTDFNSKYPWRKWALKMIAVCILMLSWLACNTVPESWHMCVL